MVHDLPCLCPEATEIRDYLNGISPALYTRLFLKNTQSALDEAMKIQNVASRNIALRKIKSIEMQLKTFYAPSEEGNTVRIFGRGESLPYLSSSIRRAFCPTLEECDLRYSQLAIVAKLLGVTSLLDFLETGRGFWDYLFEVIGFSKERLDAMDQIDRLEFKKALKENFYALIYGRTPNYAKEELNNHLSPFGAENAGDLIFDDPLIKDLVSAQQKTAKKIKEQGGGYDCFGNWISLSETVNRRSILSQQAQALELKIMYSVIALAKKTKDFRVVIWQHDGVGVNFTRRGELWKRRIAEVVEDRLREYGVVTSLEWKE